MRGAAALGVAVSCLAALAAGCGDHDTSPAAAPAAVADEWTMLAHDYSSTYHNPGERILNVRNVSGLKLDWQFDSKGEVNGAAAVRDGVVYVLAGGGSAALNAFTGALFWESPVRGGASTTLDGGTVFVNDARAVVHALDAATGVEKWRAVVDSSRRAVGYSSPVVFERYVVVGSSSIEEAAVSAGATFRGSVVAFDRDTGAELWRFYTVDPPYNGATVWSTVSIDPETRLVFASTGNNYTEEASPTSDSIFALDLDTGGLRWLTQLTEGDVFTILNPQSPDTDFGTNPILFEATVGGRRRKLVGAGQKSGVFWALDRATGAVLWSHAVSPGSALVGGMLNNGAFDGQRLIVAGNNGKSNAPGSEPSNGAFGPDTTSVLMALDPADGHTLWERQLPSWVWAPITVANGIGFVAADRELQAFDTATGAKLFVFAGAGTITSAPVVTGGRVYFGSGLSYFVGTRGRKFYALSLDGKGGGNGGGEPTYAPTFSAIYDEIIVGQSCNLTSCHASGAGNLSLSSRAEAYENLVGVAAAGPACASAGRQRVVPGNPEASLLLDKLGSLTPLCGAVMPPTGPLETRALDQVRQWILDGAPA